MKAFDAIVIGAGIIGLSLARELNKRGLHVLVVEKGEPGREASYAAGGMLADCGEENPPVLQELMTASAAMYPEFVREVQDESGVDVDLRDQGTLLLGGHRADACSQAVDREQLKEGEPQLVCGDLPVRFVPERSVDPRAMTAAVLQACKKRGVEISSRDAAVSLSLSDGRVSGVATVKTKFEAPVVVNCAGAWSCELGPVRVPTRPRKGQMLCVAMPSRTYLRHVVRSPDVYLIPRSDGRLLIGATVEDAGYDKRVDPETIKRLRQSACELLPGVGECRMLEDWAGLRPGTPDDLPILGVTEVPGYYVATGHFRDGILLAPVTAKLMAEVMVDGNTRYDISRFSAGRFA